MILWLDAQLPPSLARWMTATFGVSASAVRDHGLRDSDDSVIFEAARQAGAVMVSKDADFVDLVQRLGSPPQLIWVTCGNVSNERLEQVFADAFPATKALIEAGAPIVEIADKT